MLLCNKKSDISMVAKNPTTMAAIPGIRDYAECSILVPFPLAFGYLVALV